MVLFHKYFIRQPQVSWKMYDDRFEKEKDDIKVQPLMQK